MLFLRVGCFYCDVDTERVNSLLFVLVFMTILDSKSHALFIVDEYLKNWPVQQFSLGSGGHWNLFVDLTFTKAAFIRGWKIHGRLTGIIYADIMRPVDGGYKLVYSER